MLECKEKFSLSAIDIDKISELFCNVCDSLGMDKKEVIKQRMALENALIKWSQFFGESQVIKFESYSQLATPHVRIVCDKTESCNPFIIDDEDVYSGSILRMLTNAPEYYYQDGVNTIDVKLQKKQMNPMLKLGIIIFGSIAFSLLGLLIIPANAIASIMEYFINPIYTTFINILGTIAGPLIFFSVAWGIYGIGDVATFNKLGKSLLLTAIKYTFVGALITLCLFPLFGLTIESSSLNIGQFSSILQLILDFFPTSIIEPFATGNTLQIIIMAIVVGIALLYLGKRSKELAIAIEQLNAVVSFTMSIIGKLIPIFIALVFITLFWSGSLQMVGQIWILLVITIVALFIWAVLVTVIIGAKTRIGTKQLAKAIMPAALVALTTASSSAAFESTIESCNKLGISRSLSGFGVPLGIVTIRPGVSIGFALCSLYIAAESGMEVSIAWLITCLICCTCIAIAAPPIPGGLAIAMNMLFTQLGIPMEYVSLGLALFTILDFYMTGHLMYNIPIAISSVANRYDLIERKK